MTDPAADHRLSSVNVARFVADGYLRLDGIVPPDLCAAVLEEIDELPGYLEVGTPLADKWPDRAIGRVFRRPEVAGMIHSLVGPDPLYDHHAVHRVEAGQGKSGNLHQDSVTDVRANYFDIQISLFPQDTPAEMGGTLLVPGTQYRNVRTQAVRHYQHIAGSIYAECPAGSIYVWDTRIWHAARSNRTDRTRYMFKLRLNPTVPQVRLFDTRDLDDPSIPGILDSAQPFFGEDRRYELMKRIERWRFMSGQPDFDIGERFMRRREHNPAAWIAG